MEISQSINTAIQPCLIAQAKYLLMGFHEKLMSGGLLYDYCAKKIQSLSTWLSDHACMVNIQFTVRVDQWDIYLVLRMD